MEIQPWLSSLSTELVAHRSWTQNQYINISHWWCQQQHLTIIAPVPHRKTLQDWEPFRRPNLGLFMYSKVGVKIQKSLQFSVITFTNEKTLIQYSHIHVYITQQFVGISHCPSLMLHSCSTIMLLYSQRQYTQLTQSSKQWQQQQQPGISSEAAEEEGFERFIGSYV